jgi:mono/diheme cytochrome c family protein
VVDAASSGSGDAGPSDGRGPFESCPIVTSAITVSGSENFPPPPPPPPPGGLAAPPPPPGFPGACGPESGAVLGVLTVLGSDGAPFVNATLHATLPVDVAVSANGESIAVVAPGNAFTSNLGSVLLLSPCGNVMGQMALNAWGQSGIQPIAVAFTAANNLLVQTREPATLAIFDSNLGSLQAIPLSTSSREDTGSDIFHTQAGAMIACASCHPEGGDDGHVWMLDGQRRRTPSLRGTIRGTAPYHWPGDEATLSVLVNDVYTRRMSGAMLVDPQMTALTGWVQSIPAPRAPGWVDAAAASRGDAIFHRIDTQCSTCHSGPKFTNNQTVDVGTGSAFQVPPLVGVGWRTPLMHDGCAATLADRFGACATPQHGSTGSLSTQEIADLTAYLETL